MATQTRIDISEMNESEIKAAITRLQPMTPKEGDYVEAALLHVRKYHPTCLKVLFDDMGRWRYMDKDNEGFTFGDNMNMDLLEIASDTLNELPVLFQLGRLAPPPNRERFER